MLFVYYCRKYPNFSYTTVKGVRLNIDEDSENPTSSTCFNPKGIRTTDSQISSDDIFSMNIFSITTIIYL
jgi:hypothetical protein